MNIVVAQPLYFPAPVVAYGEKPTTCYSNPRFLGEYTGNAFDDVMIVGYEDLASCGKMARYTACQGGQELLVVYPSAATPHGFVKYGSACYAFSGEVTLAGDGSEILIPVADMSPVASCTDPACVPAPPPAGIPGGPSLVYFTVTDTGSQAVGVYFDHLSTGTAHYGVSPLKVDEGLRGLSAGSKSLHFTRTPKLLVMQSEGTGTLNLRIDGARFLKRLTVVRAGVEVQSRSLDAVTTQATLVVNPMDQVYLDASAITGRLQPFAQGARVQVSWVPQVVLPRLYDAGTLYQSGSLKALGFCGLVPHQTYTFFGTLPADTFTTGMVNPDSFVTATGAGAPERVVVRSRGQGDPLPDVQGRPWYAGQTLSSPVVFKFYTAREITGQHGEMDVWLSVNGTFPGTLSLDPYRVITRRPASYRKGTEPGDLQRGSLEVQQSTTTFFLPHQYHGPDGRLLTFHGSAATAVYGGVTYTKTGSDPGLSFDVLKPA